MIAQKNPEIRKAANALYVLSADPELRLRYEAQEKARMDRESLLADAFESGMEKERNAWQVVVADMGNKLAGKDAENERLRAENEELRARLDPCPE